MASVAGQKLAVRILPIGAWRDGFQRVPMLGDLSVLDSVQVVKRGGAIAEGPLAHYEHEIAFPEHFVSLVVLHRRAPCSQGLQTGDQASESIGDPGVVLDVGVAVEVARESIPAALEKVVHVGPHQRLVGFSLVEVRRGRRAVCHGMTARARLGGCFLQIVPMLDDLPSSNGKISKAILEFPEKLNSVWVNTSSPSSNSRTVLALTEPLSLDFKRASSAARPAPKFRLCCMYLSGLIYESGFGSPVSKLLRNSMTCCL